MSFGRIMQARRQELGLGQQELAARLAVTQQTVSRWERSDHLPPPRQFLGIAAALDVNPDAILAELGYTGEHGDAGREVVAARLQRLESTVLLTVATEALAELRGRGAP